MAYQTWMQESLCKDLDPREADKLFFISVGQTSKRAKLFCSGCPVRIQCSQYAQTYGEEGIWAGETEDDRKFTDAKFKVKSELRNQAASQGKLESRNLNDFLPPPRRLDSMVNQTLDSLLEEVDAVTQTLLEELSEVPDHLFEQTIFPLVNDL